MGLAGAALRAAGVGPAGVGIWVRGTARLPPPGSAHSLPLSSAGLAGPGQEK